MGFPSYKTKTMIVANFSTTMRGEAGSQGEGQGQGPHVPSPPGSTTEDSHYVAIWTAGCLQTQLPSNKSEAAAPRIRTVSGLYC